MSVVKVVKRRKVILEELTDEPRKKSQWWDQKERVLREWLESSSSELKEPGAVELVISQLDRGKKNPMLRLRCWKHIVVELVSLVDNDNEGRNNALGRRIRPSARRASCSTIEDVGNTMPTTESSSPHCLPVDDNEDNTVGENATDLSFLKRQAKWLRRRKESLEANIVAAEANGEVGTFSPDVSRSRSSMKTSQVLAMEHRMKEMAAEAERVSRKERREKEIRRARIEREKEERLKEKERIGSLITTSESRRFSEDSSSKAIVKGVGSRELHITPSRRTRSTLPSELRRRSTVCGTAQHSRQGRRATVQANITTSVDQAIDDDSGSSCYESEVVDVIALSQESSTAIDDLAASTTSTDEEEAEATEKDNEDTFQKGSFYTKANVQKKGHYQVRDSSQFMLTTMYKRKDRVTRKKGVSLLVGKLETPPHEEKDPKSLQQKQEMHRKQQQHKDAIQHLARRHTTATAERLLQDNSIFSSKHQSEVDLLAKEDQTAPVLLEPELAA